MQYGTSRIITGNDKHDMMVLFSAHNNLHVEVYCTCSPARGNSEEPQVIIINQGADTQIEVYSKIKQVYDT